MKTNRKSVGTVRRTLMSPVSKADFPGNAGVPHKGAGCNSRCTVLAVHMLQPYSVCTQAAQFIWLAACAESSSVRCVQSPVTQDASLFWQTQ